MRSKVKHLFVDWIALAFIVLGFVGSYIHSGFLTLMCLGIFMIFINEKINPFEGKTK